MEEHVRIALEQENQLMDELIGVIDRSTDEYDMTTIQVLGCIEKVKDLFLNMSRMCPYGHVNEEEDND